MNIILNERGSGFKFYSVRLVIFFSSNSRLGLLCLIKVKKKKTPIFFLNCLAFISYNIDEPWADNIPGGAGKNPKAFNDHQRKRKEKRGVLSFVHTTKST